jgi:hypothetical protein
MVNSSSILRYKFLETVPKNFRRHISAVKSFMSLQNQEFDWKTILRLTSGYEVDRVDVDTSIELEPEETEVWASTVAQPPPSLYMRPMQPGPSTHTEDYVSRNEMRPGGPVRQQIGRSTASGNLTCHHCNIKGHIKRDCWRFNRRCLACGSEVHRIAQCPERRSLVANTPDPSGSRTGRQVKFENIPAFVDSGDVRQSAENIRAPTGRGTPRRS